MTERVIHCPNCGQRVPPPTPAIRICAKCKQGIDRHDKYCIVQVNQDPPQFEFHHRHCDNPQAYLPKKGTA